MWVPGGQGKMEGIFPPTVTFLVTQEEMGRELDGQGGWVGLCSDRPGRLTPSLEFGCQLHGEMNAVRAGPVSCCHRCHQD